MESMWFMLRPDSAWLSLDSLALGPNVGLLQGMGSDSLCAKPSHLAFMSQIAHVPSHLSITCIIE